MRGRIPWRKAILFAAAVGGLAAAGLGGYYLLVREGILRYNEFDRRERGTLKVGEAAPDLALAAYDGSTVRLSELWREKPVVLVFGSCT
ncbi:MAG TPA: hypothetical protein VMT87_11575 [Vicinamibacteria bacterium]|nr:hypothetical protein [Vicinamibacteria bacterium]